MMTQTQGSEKRKFVTNTKRISSRVRILNGSLATLPLASGTVSIPAPQNHGEAPLPGANGFKKTTKILAYKETPSMKRTILMSATWVVVLNALVLLTHTAAHLGLHILSMTIFDYLFIGIVIMILPLVALFMLYNTHLSRWGMLLLLLSMLGSLIYGLLHHFLLPGMD